MFTTTAICMKYESVCVAAVVILLAYNRIFDSVEVFLAEG